ncbi:MAG: ATP-binding protein [Clostridia bacterium]|nr:ATP-binding protein [Clostridia bacterium]
MLIGREKEISKLNELYDADSAELVAIYGRMRVGKTHLVDEVFSGRTTFRHVGLSPLEENHTSPSSGRLQNQLAHFYRSLQMQGLQGREKPKSWLEAFYLLEDLLMEKEKEQGKIRVCTFFRG